MGFCEYHFFCSLSSSLFVSYSWSRWQMLTTCTYTNTFFCQSCDATIRGRASFTTVYAGVAVGIVGLAYTLSFHTL